MTMLQNDLGPAFPLGEVTVTPKARELLKGSELIDALLLHMRLGADRAVMEEEQFVFPFAIENRRVTSSYRTSIGRLLFIVSAADRSCTVFIFAE